MDDTEVKKAYMTAWHKWRMHTKRCKICAEAMGTFIFCKVGEQLNKVMVRLYALKTRRWFKREK